MKSLLLVGLLGGLGSGALDGLGNVAVGRMLAKCSSRGGGEPPPRGSNTIVRSGLRMGGIYLAACLIDSILKVWFVWLVVCLEVCSEDVIVDDRKKKVLRNEGQDVLYKQKPSILARCSTLTTSHAFIRHGF